MCQHSFRNPGAGKLRICLEVIRNLKTIVVFGMFSGQGSTQGNALSGEPRTSFLLGWPIFRGELLVSGSVIVLLDIITPQSGCQSPQG